MSGSQQAAVQREKFWAPLDQFSNEELRIFAQRSVPAALISRDTDGVVTGLQSCGLCQRFVTHTKTQVEGESPQVLVLGMRVRAQNGTDNLHRIDELAIYI